MAESEPRSDTCFNPFKSEKHVRVDRKKLRKILPGHLRKLKIPVTPISLKYYICNSCRLRMAKFAEMDENSRDIKPRSGSVNTLENMSMANSSVAHTTGSDINSSLGLVSSGDIRRFNTCLITLRDSPAIERALEVQKTRSPKKSQQIHETIGQRERLPYTFRGHVVPVLAPFLKDSTRSLNLSIIPQYASFLADRGITGVLVNGTSGEGPLLTTAERKSLAEAWAHAVKPTKQHLMIQVGGASLPDVLELARHAESIGVDSLLCLPELYFKPTTPNQLVEYLRLVGQAAPKTPLLYYHIPMMTNVNINMVQFLEAVGEMIPSFVGMKFTNTNLEEAAQILHFNNKEFVIFLGSDQIMAAAFALGMDSAIGTTCNMFPELGIEILKASTSGDMEKARKAQQKLSIATLTISKYGQWVETMKVAMGLLTPLDLGPVRSPLTPLSAESVAAMKADLKALGYQVLR